MKNWIFTGISGSGRIELLNELGDEIKKYDKSVNVFDLGNLIFKAAKEINIKLSDEKVLDIDQNLLFALRKIALERIMKSMSNKEVDFNFIGIHATFRWKERLIKGITYRDLLDFDLDGLVNVVDDVKKIVEINSKNPKWLDIGAPDTNETNNWLIEEEFVTEILSDVFKVPMYLIGRQHNIENLAELFLTSKNKFYLSYPITHIEEDNPDLLRRIRNEVLPSLEKQFIIFDPLVIGDMKVVYRGEIKLPDSVEKLSKRAISSIKTRTIERDFQFIDQSDFIVVIYLTEKISVGVLSEIIYASNNNKPVYMVFPYKRSPFLEHYATNIFNSLDGLLEFFKADKFQNDLRK